MKSKKAIAGYIVVGIIAVLSVLFLLSSRKNEVEPEFVLSYAENQTKTYPTTRGGYRFAELVEERTEGRIRILVQPDAVMGDEKSVVSQMQFGGVDFSRVSLASLSEFLPELRVLQMPYLYTGSEHMWQILDGEIGDEFLKVIDNNDLVGLSWYDAGVRNFYTSGQPIEKLEDVSGLRIRVIKSSLMSDIIVALGAEAVQIDYADVYSALQRQDVDGAENNWPSYETMGHYEVAPYYTVDEHSRVPEVQICSAVTWNKLSPEDQKILRECAEESALYQRQLWTQEEKTAKQIALDNGVQVIELSEQEKKRFQEAVIPVYEKYCTDYMDIIDKIIAAGKD